MHLTKLVGTIPSQTDGSSDYINFLQRFYSLMFAAGRRYDLIHLSVLYCILHHGRLNNCYLQRTKLLTDRLISQCSNDAVNGPCSTFSHTLRPIPQWAGIKWTRFYCFVSTYWLFFICRVYPFLFLISQNILNRRDPLIHSENRS